MFTGNLIEDLIATVERAEQHALPERAGLENDAIQMTAWSGVVGYELAQVEHKLLGVA
jgi:hypothetical protein